MAGQADELARIRARGEAFGRSLGTLILNLCGLTGASSIAYGAWLIYPPAGFITGGAELLAGVILIARRKSAHGKPAG